MNLIIYNNASGYRVPRTFLNQWLKTCQALLAKKRVKLAPAKELVLVFVSPNEIKKMNLTYRKKNKVTDILSFESGDPESLGELILCPSRIEIQSKDHGLTLKEELGYLVLHGILHLKGFDHETNEQDAKRMFDLQDRVFELALRKSSKTILK